MQSMPDWFQYSKYFNFIFPLVYQFNFAVRANSTTTLQKDLALFALSLYFVEAIAYSK